MRAVSALGADEVRLYHADDTIRDAALRARYDMLLTPDERARHDRLRFAADRDRFLVSRALIRFVLARHLGVEPEDLVFDSHRWGKPFLASPSVPRLFFNGSHTRGAVACAVARDDELGIDIELIDRDGPATAIFRSTFAASEIEALDALQPPLAAQRFVDYWVLKEAYTKGRGMGLSLPLNSFAIELCEGREPRIAVEPAVDDGLEWRFQLSTIAARHRVACAVRRSVPFALCIVPIVPFADDSDVAEPRVCE